jgi:hypothetical protein
MLLEPKFLQVALMVFQRHSSQEEAGTVAKELRIG